MIAFASICQKLLAGQMIDAVRYPALYDVLHEAGNLTELNAYLEKMAYQCVATEQGGGFYLVHMDSTGEGVRRAVKEQFERFVSTIEPMVRFLQVCRNATERPILTGERVEFAQILAYIDNSPLAKDELSQIVGLLNRSSTGVKNQLTSVLAVLENDGYLHALSDDKTVFLATAKWELFYEQIRYIGECQSIITDKTPTPTQGELL